MRRRCYVYLIVCCLSVCSTLVSANSLITQFEHPQHHWAHYLIKPDVLPETDAKRLQQDPYLGLFIQEVAVQELARLWTLAQQPDFSMSQLQANDYNFSNIRNIRRQGRTPFAYFASTEAKLGGSSSSDMQLAMVIQAHANQGHGDTGTGITLSVPLNLRLSLQQLRQLESLEQVEAWARAEVRLDE
ncbi:hypothetical protein [Agarivorans sp.]|uniref:hypothetical protein n=1 Tax=Agarivorans sp. TaxID=1872412 RepID=UPI003CFC34F5